MSRRPSRSRCRRNSNRKARLSESEPGSRAGEVLFCSESGAPTPAKFCSARDPRLATNRTFCAPEIGARIAQSELGMI